MVRTQIQLPDEVFAQAKQVCEARGISLAELARRGIECILSMYAEPSVNQAEWHPPKPRWLGWKGLNVAELKAEAQKNSSEAAL